MPTHWSGEGELINHGRANLNKTKLVTASSQRDECHTSLVSQKCKLLKIPKICSQILIQDWILDSITTLKKKKTGQGFKHIVVFMLEPDWYRS